MGVRYMVVGLNYGCEVKPTLDFLRIAFPELTFTDETEFHRTFSSSWAIFAEVEASKIDHVRSVATAFRDGFNRGYVLGFNDPSR